MRTDTHLEVYLRDLGDNLLACRGVLTFLTLSCTLSRISRHRDYVPEPGETLESFASSMTTGIDARGGAQVVPTFNGNGR